MWRIGCHVPLPAARLRGNWGRQRRGCDPPRGTNGVLRPRGCPDDGVRGARSGIGVLSSHQSCTARNSRGWA